MRWTLGLGSVFAVLQVLAVFRNPFHWVSATLYGMAILLFWWSIRVSRRKEFGACFQAVAPLVLVTEGPYRWVRHPFYLSYLLAWCAGCFVYAPLAVAPCVMGAMYWRAASEEERLILASPLGKQYERYRQRTGRFFISIAGILRTVQEGRVTGPTS
jgi:protein-S-isoprenylcysteine O-methyltransferase Ste14